MISFTDMNIKLDKTVKTFSFKDKNINVLQYLPIEEKNELIQLALQNSEENGVYNPLKIDMFSELYLVYLYTDIEFTDEQKANAAETYDALKSSGLLGAIVANMNVSEYEYLGTMLNRAMEGKLKYRNTIASVVNNLMENLPVNAENAAEIINKFNPEDFQRVIEFAQAANGGRPIN